MDIEHLSAFLAQIATILTFFAKLVRWLLERSVDKRDRKEQESRKQ